MELHCTVSRFNPEQPTASMSMVKVTLWRKWENSVVLRRAGKVHVKSLCSGIDFLLQNDIGIKFSENKSLIQLWRYTL